MLAAGIKKNKKVSRPKLVALNKEAENVFKKICAEYQNEKYGRRINKIDHISYAVLLYSKALQDHKITVNDDIPAKLGL